MTDLYFNVMTWNYGKHSDDKMKNALNALFDTKQDTNNKITINDIDENTVYILGLQEVHTNQNEYIQNFIRKYCFDNTNELNIVFSTCNANKMNIMGSGNFMLLNIIISKKQIEQTDNNQCNKKSSNSTISGTALHILQSTKGENINRLKIDGKHITIINVHLPLDTAEYLEQNIIDLFTQTNDNTPTIWLGDFNFRSMINDGCLKDCNIQFSKRITGVDELIQKMNDNDTNEIMKTIRENDYLYKMCNKMELLIQKVNNYRKQERQKDEEHRKKSNKTRGSTPTDLTGEDMLNANKYSKILNIIQNAPYNVGDKFVENEGLDATYSVDNKGKYNLQKTINNKNEFVPTGIPDRIFSKGFNLTNEKDYTPSLIQNAPFGGCYE